MIVIGVDPGLQTSGYALIEQVPNRIRILDAGTIKIKPDQPLAHRLERLYHDFDELLSEYHIDIMALEELYAHYKHPRTAILMGHARGVFLLAAARHHIEVADFAATRVKKAITGNGRAGKEQVQRAVAGQLNLNAIPQPPDVADALALALCCLNQHQPQRIAL